MSLALIPKLQIFFLKLFPKHKFLYLENIEAYRFQHYHIGEEINKWQQFINSVPFYSFNKIIFYVYILSFFIFTLVIIFKIIKFKRLSNNLYFLLLVHFYVYGLLFLKYEIKEFRYLFPILPFIYLFAAFFIEKVSFLLKFSNKFLIIFFSIFGFYNLLFIYLNISNERIPYVKAQKYILANIKNNMNILADNMYIPEILFRYEIKQKKIEKFIPNMRNKKILEKYVRINLFTTPISLKENEKDLMEKNFFYLLNSDLLSKMDYIIVSKNLYGRFLELDYPNTKLFYNYLKNKFNCVFNQGNIFIYKN